MDTLAIFDRHLNARKGDQLESVEHLVLPFEQRQKARHRVRLESGREIGIQLPRGTVLRNGDLLESSTGELVSVIAAAEAVSTVTTVIWLGAMASCSAQTCASAVLVPWPMAMAEV